METKRRLSLGASQNRSRSCPRAQPYLALFLLLTIAAFLCVTPFVDIHIRHYGDLSRTDHALFIAGITIGATLLTSYAVGQIRQLWVLYYIFEEIPAHHGSALSRRARKANTIIGLSCVADQVRFWRITASFTAAGLVTTSIVAGLSATPVQVTTPTIYSKLALDHISEQCLAQDATGGWFSWQLPDGSGVSVNTTHNQLCETQMPTEVLKYLLYPPGGFAYSMAGIAVDKSAIGAPFNLLSYGFDGSFGAGADHMSMDPMFQWATQCFPVLGTNPVKCQEGGNVTINTNSITVSANNCEISTPIYSVDPSTQGASAAGACTSGNVVGTATLVFGSVNSQARLLTSVFRETSFNGSTFAAFCTVDIGPSLPFRALNYSGVSVQLDSDSEEGFQFFVSGSDSTCTQRNGTHEISLDQLQTPTALATGAAASWQLLAEGAYADGWWATLWDAVADQYRFNFKSSRNSLEDRLGHRKWHCFRSFFGVRYLLTTIFSSHQSQVAMSLTPA